jgi:glycerol-3-phosphate dehydrogenase (NAD(P)+)
MTPLKTVAVIGSGAFGTALATVIADAGKADVTLHARNALLAQMLQERQMHDAALPGIRLSPKLKFSAEPDILGEADIVLFVMPSQSQRDAARHFGPFLKKGAVVVTCAKGIEKATGELLTSVLEEEIPDHSIAVLSGPGFAADIASGLPTAMVIASEELKEAIMLAETLSGRSFRLYPSEDRIGVQLGGALKNVLAIACGIVEGAGLGDSARAALIARGLAEMSRFVAAKGGSADTVRGLSGLGDLVLTATSHQSRNLRFGISLGKGEKATGSVGELVEGAYAASVSAALSRKAGIEMPITEAVAAIIDGTLDVNSALERLMSRPIRNE